ncbi:unnamed protein product [Owenia fusiformis]|uniref:Uncharacterized protein n=1 Tax=Owenia fusiformis TaxID=6347 RepID=A0A8S4NLV2_OWEFU|nr:unnamed protein product [Owenia fusiformis]
MGQSNQPQERAVVTEEYGTAAQPNLYQSPRDQVDGSRSIDELRRVYKTYPKDDDVHEYYLELRNDVNDLFDKHLHGANAREKSYEILDLVRRGYNTVKKLMTYTRHTQVQVRLCLAALVRGRY